MVHDYPKKNGQVRKMFSLYTIIQSEGCIQSEEGQHDTGVYRDWQGGVKSNNAMLSTT